MKKVGTNNVEFKMTSSANGEMMSGAGGNTDWNRIWQGHPSSVTAPSGDGERSMVSTRAVADPTCHSPRHVRPVNWTPRRRISPMSSRFEFRPFDTNYAPNVFYINIA